jgi:hypothetical protein
MPTRVKRTYNLDPRTVRAVRELADDYDLAPSQDAVVELAIAELRRQVREREESEAWDRAAKDPTYRAEVGALEQDFLAADLETWPPDPD